jgi:hypothetical protein
MNPFGDNEGPDDQGKRKREDNVEERFREQVRKRVRITLPENHRDTDSTSRVHTPFRFDPAAPQTLTGARNTHLDATPRKGKHPLTAGQRDELEDGSYRLARRTDDTFQGARDQPTMAGTFLAGDSMSAHTSMKGWATPTVHPVVRTVLDDLRHRVARGENLTMGAGHGRCAEIGTISDYLWNVDPGGTMTVEDARAHFEHVGGATAAHQTHPDRHGRFHLRPACATCAYVTQKLVIATLSEEY